MSGGVVAKWSGSSLVRGIGGLGEMRKSQVVVESSCYKNELEKRC